MTKYQLLFNIKDMLKGAHLYDSLISVEVCIYSKAYGIYKQDKCILIVSGIKGKKVIKREYINIPNVSDMWKSIESIYPLDYGQTYLRGIIYIDYMVQRVCASMEYLKNTRRYIASHDIEGGAIPLMASYIPDANVYKPVKKNLPYNTRYL